VTQRIQLVIRLYLVRYETDDDTQYHPEETDISDNEWNPRELVKENFVWLNVTETIRNKTYFILQFYLIIWEEIVLLGGSSSIAVFNSMKTSSSLHNVVTCMVVPVVKITGSCSDDLIY
jgi:hypothetical protein